jgi:pimeloyl-ACP methyl ester carboxylesterase
LARPEQAGEPRLMRVAGLNLEVLAGGRGDPLLVLHDYEYLNAWHPFLVRLAERCWVLVPSHPGFGASELPQDVDTIQDIAYLYLDLARELGSVSVLGLGIGGWIAAEMAVRCTPAVRKPPWPARPPA